MEIHQHLRKIDANSTQKLAINICEFLQHLYKNLQSLEWILHFFYFNLSSQKLKKHLKQSIALYLNSIIQF